MTFDFLGAPLIYRNRTVETPEAFIKRYASKLTPDMVIVAEQCGWGAWIDPRPRLCIQDEYGLLVTLAFYDTVTEAESARLQFIRDYNIKDKEENYQL